MAEQWTERQVEWSIKDIGAPLLDSLARGLYSKLEVLREYVQNAADAYVDFQRLTGRAPQNTIQIWVDPDNGAVHFMDAGIGMDWDDVNTAKAIAVSPKLARPNDFAGFRGLGIWSGLAACDQLEITTTKVDVPFAYRLTINCQDIVAHLEDPIPIDELLQGRFKIHESPSEASDHFTHAKLVGVHQDRYRELLDATAVTRYAEQHFPVPFDPLWPYTPQVQKALESVPWTTNYELTVNGQPVYRRLPPKADIKEPQREVIRHRGKEVAVAWWCETARRGQKKALDVGGEKPWVRNFAIRVKNFAIGQRGLYADHHVTDPGNLDWYVGEIYITDPDIRPDTKRTHFQPSTRHDDAVEALQEFYTSVALGARGWSQQVTVEGICDAVEVAGRDIEALIAAADTAQPESEDQSKALRDQWAVLQDLERQLQAHDAEARRTDNVEQEAQRTLIARRYLRKREVKARMETALVYVAGLRKRIEQAGPMVSTAAADAVQTPTGRRARVRARTATLRGKAATTRDLLAVRMVAGSLPGVEPGAPNGDTPGDEIAPQGGAAATLPAAVNGAAAAETGNGREPQISIETAMAAVAAAVAAVVGSQSETYRLIMARVPVEFQRRGAYA